MPIDPLSVATQGFIINDSDKIIIPITVATLGWIKPARAITPVGFTKKVVGGASSSGKALSYKSKKPLEKKLEQLDIKICVGLTKINNEEISEEEITKRYLIENEPIAVIITKIRFNEVQYLINIHNVTNMVEQPTVVLDNKNIKLLPIKTLVSGSRSAVKKTNNLFIVESTDVKKK